MLFYNLERYWGSLHIKNNTGDISMKKNKTDIKKTDSSVEAPGSQSKEDKWVCYALLTSFNFH